MIYISYCLSKCLQFSIDGEMVCKLVWLAEDDICFLDVECIVLTLRSASVTLPFVCVLS